MENNRTDRILFIINPGSGTNKIDWPEAIRNYFTKLDESIKLFELQKNSKPAEIRQLIDSFRADRVIAVGGDGTVNLVAQAVLQTNIPVGILPAGSANGMAKELGIPVDTEKALEIAVNGDSQLIHAIKINNQLSLHLSDLGFNAYVVKKFKSYNKRGMWSYVKAAWKVISLHRRMWVEIKTDEATFRRHAIMVVIANATKYGSGATINPDGRLDDDVFEVVVIKRVSFVQAFRVLVLNKPYDPKHSEVFRTRSLEIKTHPMHFQADGEYLGKVQRVEATIVEKALNMIIPRKENS